MQFVENKSLKTLNSLSMEAKAEWFCKVTSPDDLQAAIEFANARQLPIFPLGGGTNIVLLGDLEGLVICNQLQGVTLDDDRVTVAAGENWHQFVEKTLNAGLFGLENLALIPGTVGAAPIQNIGAYGVELSESFESLTAIDTQSGETVNFDKRECEFGYRDSIFKKPHNYLITELRLRLSHQDRPKIDYPGIADYLDTHQLDVNAQNVFKAVVAVRQSKLPDPAIDPNVGSFFKNPIVSLEQAERLREQHDGIPVFLIPEDNSKLKLSAAWMIEQAGLKGETLGGFQVSPKHALVIVNQAQGSSDELRQLIDQVRGRVEEKYGVALDVEPGIYPN